MKSSRSDDACAVCSLANTAHRRRDRARAHLVGEIILHHHHQVSQCLWTFWGDAWWWRSPSRTCPLVVAGTGLRHYRCPDAQGLHVPAGHQCEGGNFELEPVSTSLRIGALVVCVCVRVCCAVRPATFPVCVRVVPLCSLAASGYTCVPVLLLRSSCSSFSLVSRNSAGCCRCWIVDRTAQDRSFADAGTGRRVCW